MRYSVLIKVPTNKLTLIKKDHRKEIRKKGNVYLTMHSTHFIYAYMVLGHMVKDHSDSKRGNPLLSLHGLLFLIRSKGSFICIVWNKKSTKRLS